MENLQPLPQLIPELPDDIALQCLLRASFKSYPSMRCVCRRWRSLLVAPDFRTQRKLSSLSDHCVCFVQPLPRSSIGSGRKHHPCYGISVYEPKQGTWEWLPPIPDLAGSGRGAPLFCQCLAVGACLVVVGGWDLVTWQTTRSVYIFDFTSWRWKRGADMLAVRSFFACGVLGHCILVAGGHDDSKNALRTVEMYDTLEDKWVPLTPMWQERDECKGAVVGGKFHVFSGYTSDTQGQFMRSYEVLDMGWGDLGSTTSSWRQVEEMWAQPNPPLPRAMVAFRGALHALFRDELSVYEPAKKNWKVLERIPEALGFQACNSSSSSPCAITVVGDCIFMGATILSAEGDSSSTHYLVRRGPGQWTLLTPTLDFVGHTLSACTIEI